MRQPENRRRRADQIICCVCLGLFFAAQLAVCARIYPYGDDFFYAEFARHGWDYYLQRLAEHYWLANGRVVVHVLATAFLAVNIWVWRMVNALALTACAALSVLVALPQAERRWPAVATAAALLLLIDSSVARQSIYWLDGSCNYVYPLLLLLLYWLLLRRFLRKPRRPLLMAVLAFVAAATTEQGGAMCFGLTVLLLADAWLRRGRPLRPVSWAVLACSLVGWLSVILAPSVGYRRALTASPVAGGPWQLIQYNVRLQGSYLLSPHVMGWYWLLLAGCGLYYAITRSGKAPAGENGGEPTLAVALILGLGSQAMLAVSPVYGPRVLLSFIVMAVVCIVRAAGGLFRQPEAMPLLLALVLAAGLHWQSAYQGYTANAEIYQQNITAIAQYRASGNAGELTQRQLPQDSCAWVMPYQNAYYDPYYKLYFALPADTRIIWLPADTAATNQY